MNLQRQHLEERRDLALRDLIEVEEQLRRGELDEDHAERLRADYEAEAAAALRALEAPVELPDDTSSSSSGSRALGLARPMTAVVATLAAAGVAIAVLPGALSNRPDGGFVTGNEATGEGDLDEVTDAEMEAVVAENPDIVPMRLRLAHRYLDQGDYEAAFRHYRAVLDREDDPEAMSHLGWVLFNQGEPELAEQLIEASLDREPAEPEALWFLANVRLLGTDDPAGALAPLNQLVERSDLADEDREAVEEARQAAKSLVEDTEGS